MPVKKGTGSTRDFSYQILKTKILNLELKPGTKISEKEIADELSVSRTPVREAFMMLAQEDLLDVIPQIGTIVSKINLEYVEEGRFIREKIEKEIVALACELFPDEYKNKLEKNIALQELCAKHNNHHELFELDEEFHQLIFKGCRKERTWRMLELLNSHFNRLRLLRLTSNSNWEIIIYQHKKVFQFITESKKKEAMEIMEQHLRLVVIEQNDLKVKYPEYFI